jgi:hypothetical protein
MLYTDEVATIVSRKRLKCAATGVRRRSRTRRRAEERASARRRSRSARYEAGAAPGNTVFRVDNATWFGNY